jgi:hypothetical protein
VSSAPKVLGATQAKVLCAIGPALHARGFYLAGGTAVALHLGHRRSVDLDWFTAGSFGDSHTLAAALCAQGISFQTATVARGTLHGTVSGARVSMLEFPYPMLKAPLLCPVSACKMASLDDLAAMKLSAIVQRGSRKDFVDIYALSVRHAPLADMLEWYQRKFSVGEVGHVVYALSYLDDAEKEPMPAMLWRVNWRTIKAHIRRSVAAFAR